MVVDITVSCLRSKQTGSYSSLSIGCKDPDDVMYRIRQVLNLQNVLTLSAMYLS